MHKDKDPELGRFASGRPLEPAPTPSLDEALRQLGRRVHRHRPWLNRYHERGVTPQDIALTKRIVGERDDE